MKYRCTVCGHVYDEEKEGVKFADLPETWVCPICKQPKSKFEPVEEETTVKTAEIEELKQRLEKLEQDFIRLSREVVYEVESKIPD